jgi:catechol 2,3-dioxygenase-like lactoylglutathione lyase family enzyme
MSDTDLRPPLWVGHIQLSTSKLPESYAFMQALGMRPLVEQEGFGILELRAGTHLILQPSEEPNEGLAGFDLMVEDIDATHARLVEAGVSPSEIEPGNIHRAFTVQDPGGARIKFNSTHASDHPV